MALVCNDLCVAVESFEFIQASLFFQSGDLMFFELGGLMFMPEDELMFGETEVTYPGLFFEVIG